MGIGEEVYGNVSAVSFRHIARRHRITCVVQKIRLSFLLKAHFYAFGLQPFGRLLYLSPSHLVPPCITPGACCRYASSYVLTAKYHTRIYTVRLLSFRTDCAERILRAPSGIHPQKHVGASIDTCA